MNDESQSILRNGTLLIGKYSYDDDMGKKRTSKKLSDQIRQAVDECGVSRYRIWQDTGLSEPLLSLFMSGKRGLSMKALDKLADYLGLEITVKAKPKGRDK